MTQSIDNHESLAETGSRAAHGVRDSIVYRELSTIIPVIATVMAQQANADSCSFYVYDADGTRTVATFRHGAAQLIFPDPTDVDTIAPFDVPVEAEVLRTGQSIKRSTTEDFERWPLVADSIRELGDSYHDVIIPLIRHNRIYGVVYLWRTGGLGEFTDAEVSAAERLAHVAAMAVEFARQYVSERQRRLRLNALLNVASLAASHLTVEEVMPEVTRIVRSVTEADICNLYVFDDTGDAVTSSFSSGLNERERWVFDQSDLYPVSTVPAEERARETLSPVIVHDPANELAPESELVTYAAEASLSEILILPLVYQGAMIGVIYLWYRDNSRSFSEDAKLTAQGIANQAGGVIHQARLYDASQRHISETEALRRIGDTVLASESLESTLDEIADVLYQMIRYDFALVGRVDCARDEIVIQRVWGGLPESLMNYRISISSSLMGEVVRTGEILNAPDAYADPRMHRYQPERLPIRSVLIAPLISDGVISGVLYLGRADTAGYTARQEQLMELLSQRAAIAIERTRARESLAQHAARQTFLANVTSRLIAVEDPVEVLQEICEMGSGILADGVAIAHSSWQYGSVRWVAAAHADPDLHESFHRSLMEQQVVVSEDRIEELLASEDNSLMPLQDGAPSDGRELHPSVVELLSKIGARHLLNVPMRQAGRAPGILALVTSDENHVFDEDLREMAQIVASRIGDALERQRMARNRESLLRVSEAINAHAGLDDLLDMFESELHGIVPFDQFYLGTRDSASESTVSLKFLNPFGLNKSEVTLASNEGVSGEVMRTRKAVLDNAAHLRASSAYGSDEELAYYQAHGESVMAAPLIAEDQVLGVLFIGRFGSNRFSEADFETFLLFSGLTASAIHRTKLLQSNQSMYRASVEVLAAAVDAKDPTTLEHSRNVSRYARIIAIEAGLPTSEIERIELAALLHDIGKLSIPDHVLSKPGPLNPQERALINTHPERGASILMQHPVLTNLAPLVRHHHERIDGKGYPDGIAGDEIPLGARIISIAGAFDTMTTERSYQRKRLFSEGLDELNRCAGAQFDSHLVDVFVGALRREPGQRS